MAPRYGDFTFDSCSGFTGSVKRKAFKRGGYAEGGMRSERTEVAKASRDVQDNALAPAKQLNKSLKNLYNTRKQTGYDGSEGYSKGGPKKLTPGEDPRQMLLGDIQPVTQKERLEAAASKPLRGSANQKSSDDLFRPLEPDMLDLMKRKKGGKVAYAGGGLHKMRSDKGVTGEVPGVKMGRRSTKIPGMLAPMNAGPKIKNPTVTATSSPLSNIALKRGGKAKK
jgi:hypothetical protein